MYVHVNQKKVKKHLPPIWNHTRNGMSLEGTTTVYKKGYMLGWWGNEGFGDGRFCCFISWDGGSGTGGDEKSTCFTFSGAGSCKWLTSKGVMRGTVWKPSSTEGGLVPFSPVLLFSFTTILRLFFPDLRQAGRSSLQWEVRPGKRKQRDPQRLHLGGFQCTDQGHWSSPRFPDRLLMIQENFHHQNMPPAHRAQQPSNLGNSRKIPELHTQKYKLEKEKSTTLELT